MDALLVEHGAITRIVLPEEPNNGEIHRLIGDWFSICFAMYGAATGRKLVAYCDDNYFKKPGPWNVILDTTLYGVKWPVRGPIVITAAMLPATVSMTAAELRAFAIGNEWQIISEDPWGEPLDATAPLLTFTGYDR